MVHLAIFIFYLTDLGKVQNAYSMYQEMVSQITLRYSL